MHQKTVQKRISSAEFGRLYSRYSPRFIEVAYRYVRERSVAEDLVSESFMAFWEERDRLPEDVNVPGYVLAIVKNKCLNHLKSRLRHLQIEKTLHSTQQRLIQSDIQSLTACVPDNLFVEEIRTMLDRAVGRMPELTRRVFEGSRYEDKSYKELAEELNIAFTHVNFEMRRALKILREEFKDYIFLPLICLISGHLI